MPLPLAAPVAIAAALRCALTRVCAELLLDFERHRRLGQHPQPFRGTSRAGSVGDWRGSPSGAILTSSAIVVGSPFGDLSHPETNHTLAVAVYRVCTHSRGLYRDDPHGVRATGCRPCPRAVAQSRGWLAEPGPQTGGPTRRCRGGGGGPSGLPPRPLATDWEHQSAGAAQQGGDATHQCGRHRPQPGGGAAAGGGPCGSSSRTTGGPVAAPSASHRWLHSPPCRCRLNRRCWPPVDPAAGTPQATPRWLTAISPLDGTLTFPYHQALQEGPPEGRVLARDVSTPRTSRTPWARTPRDLCLTPLAPSVQ